MSVLEQERTEGQLCCSPEHEMLCARSKDPLGVAVHIPWIINVVPHVPHSYSFLSGFWGGGRATVE